MFFLLACEGSVAYVSCSKVVKVCIRQMDEKTFYGHLAYVILL
jgi:hypothetical protein